MTFLSFSCGTKIIKIRIIFLILILFQSFKFWYRDNLSLDNVVYIDNDKAFRNTVENRVKAVHKNLGGVSGPSVKN